METVFTEILIPGKCAHLQALYPELLLQIPKLIIIFFFKTGSHSVPQAGLKLVINPVSASQELGLQMRVTMARSHVSASSLPKAYALTHFQISSDHSEPRGHICTPASPGSSILPLSFPKPFLYFIFFQR